MSALKRLRPAIEKDLPLGHAAMTAPLQGTPRWDYLMTLARSTALSRDERVKVVGGWVERNGRGYWVYVIECASWCGCRRLGS